MELLVFTREGKLKYELDDFNIEVVVGMDENDFELTIDSNYAPEAGDFIAIDRTEYGGIVDELKTQTDVPGVIVCSGRTWHGMLAGKIVSPPSGQDYKIVNGEPSAILKSFITEYNLPFTVKTTEFPTIQYQFERYIDAYEGICDMLADNGYKLMFTYKGGIIYCYVAEAETLDDAVTSDLMDFEITSTNRCINHIIIGGKGELKDREIVHLYIDKNGKVSNTQTYFGVDEITYFYDLSARSGDQLVSDGTTKLKKLYTTGKVEATVYDGFEANVGDIIRAQDSERSLNITATIEKKIARIKSGVTKISYEIGTPTTKKIRG